jgi:hypothetical protein
VRAPRGAQTAIATRAARNKIRDCKQVCSYSPLAVGDDGRSPMFRTAMRAQAIALADSKKLLSGTGIPSPNHTDHPVKDSTDPLEMRTSRSSTAPNSSSSCEGAGVFTGPRIRKRLYNGTSPTPAPVVRAFRMPAYSCKEKPSQHDQQDG